MCLINVFLNLARVRSLFSIYIAHNILKCPADWDGLLYHFKRTRKVSLLFKLIGEPNFCITYVRLYSKSLKALWILNIVYFMLVGFRKSKLLVLVVDRIIIVVD